MTVREMMKEVGFPFVFDRCDDIIVFGDSKRIEEGEYELGSRFIEIREDGTVEAFEYDDEYGEKSYYSHFSYDESNLTAVRRVCFCRF